MEGTKCEEREKWAFQWPYVIIVEVKIRLWCGSSIFRVTDKYQMLRRDSLRNRKTICQHHWFNDRPHRENIMNQNCDAETVKKTERTSNSLDLNIIKHVWDVLQRKVQQCVPPKTNNFEVSLLYKWDRILRMTFIYSFEISPTRQLALIWERGPPNVNFCWTNCRVLSKQIMQWLNVNDWTLPLIGIVSIAVNLFFLSKWTITISLFRMCITLQN